MATLDQLKALFPDARSDSDLIKQAASEFGISPADIAAEVGVKISTPGFGTSVKRGIGQVESALGSTARDLGLERAGRALEAYGEDVAFRNPAAVNTVSEAISSPWQTTKEALGELVPQIGVSGATALGGRALGGLAGIPFGPAGVAAGQAIGGTAGAYLGNLAQEYGGIRSEQRESGKEDKARALAAGGAAAVLDTAVGVERLVNKVGNKGLDILSRGAGEKLAPHVIKQTGLGIATEAGTETAQTALERYGAFKDLTGADALNEYGMAAIKGGIGGGVVRGGLSAIAGERTSLIPDTDQGATPTAQGAPANDISQTFQANDRTTPDTIMSGLVGRAADPLAGRSALVGQVAAPAVAGGETEIAQVQQQAQAESQQIQAAQAQQARREQIYTEYGIADPQNPTKGNLFGKPLFGRAVPAVADAIGTATQTMTPYQLELAQAVNQANTETGGKLLNFQFNANDPAKSVQKAFEAVGKVAVGFQIADAQSTTEAAQILNEQSKALTGAKLDQLNAIHYALTGEDTVGFTEAQQSKAAKGAKDGKLQLQDNAGLRNVPVQGGTGKATDGGDGNVRPTQVQPVGATGLGEGSLGLQVGQLPTEGIRAGTSADTSVGDGQPTPNTQVIGAPNEATQAIVGGGQVSGEQQQAPAAQVGGQSVQAGPRIYATPPSYYATDLSHIQSERRVNIILDLLTTVLKPQQERKNTVPAETRAELLRLALMEQMPHKTIAEVTGLKVDTVEKQLERMGVKLQDGEFQVVDPALAVSVANAAANYRSPEFPDGIGEGELMALYTTRYEGEDAPTQSMADEFEQEAKPEAKLQEELRGKDEGEGKTMGVVATAGGSQGAVEGTDDAFFAKVGKLQAMLDMASDADKPNVQKQLDAAWAQYGKKQTKRIEANRLEEVEGEEDAVQEPSTEEVPVRKRARGGKAVGEGNAKGGKAAAKSETKVEEPKQEVVVQTPEEQWSALAEQFPGMPPYESLTKDEKIRWDDLASRGVANLAAANKILGSAVKAGPAETPRAGGATETVEDEERFEREMRAAATGKQTNSDDVKTTALRFVPFETALDIARRAVAAGVPMNWVQFHTRLDLINESANRLLDALRAEQNVEVSGIRFMRVAQTRDIDGVEVTANETTLGALERNRGVWNAIDSYRQTGVEHILKAVDGWYVTDDNVDWDGSFMALDGKPSIAFKAASLKNDAIAEWTTHHEIGHAIDMLHKDQGGVYSGLPGLNVSVVGNRIVARGDVMRAVVDHYNAEPNSMLSQHLVYPLDRTQNADLDADGVREEVFAQLWATYNTVDGREFLETNLPNVADFMEAVYEDVKQTQYVTETTNGTAPQGRAGIQGQGRGPQPRQVRLQAAAIRANKTQEINDRPTGMFTKAGSWLDTMLTNPKQAYQELKLGFLTLEQLAELDKSPTQVVRAYADVATAMQMTSKRLVERAAQIDQLWSKLDAETSKRLSNVMRQATRMSFDPDTYVEEDGKELTPDQSALRSEFETLPSKAQEVYRRVRDHYAASFEMRKAIMEDVGARLGGKELKEIQDMYSKVKGPYFPLGRTGDFYAVGMSPRVAELMDKKDAGTLDRKEAAELSRLRKQKSQYQASAHSTLAEAQQAAAQYRNTLGTGYANKKSERISDRISSMPNFSNMEEYINTQLGGETRTEVRSMLTQMMFDMLPEHHALKNQMKREGIYGENEDMRQVFAQTSINQAHYISRLQHSEQLNQAMLAIGRQARRDLEMRNLENELKLRTKMSMEQTNSPVVDAMVNASYFAHLGLSPAFLLTNLTQVPMVTAPWLGARHGVGATKRAMASSLADTAKIIKTTYANGDWRSELNWNSMFPEGSNEDRMFRALLDRNVLDITMEHDLAAIASANRGFFDDNIAKASKGKLQGMSDVVRMVNTPVRITELANRAVTALSAYRLKMAALASNTAMTPEQRHEASVSYAARAVSETQLNYSELNAPRHMRQVFGSKAIAKMVFQFRKYQQGMLYLVAKSISDSLPRSKASDEDRRIARRTIAGLYITTGLMAGTTGMPLMGTVGLAGIANLIAAAFGEEDEPWDFETEYRNFLTDWFGRDAALLLAKGLPAYLGADLSQRVGMAELANPIPFVQRGATGASTVANVLYAAGGAPVGMIGTMYDGLVAMANGDTLKGVEKIIPVKMMKDALRMYRYTDEGLTDRRGNVILPPEKFDTIDLALRGMGFTPTIESEYYAANEAVQSAKTAATDVRTRLIRQYSEARMRGEPVDDIRQDIAQFNQRHPEQSVRITESTLLKALNARRQMAAQRNEAGVRISKAEKPFADRARFATANEE